MNRNNDQCFIFTKDWEDQFRSIPQLANRILALESTVRAIVEKLMQLTECETISEKENKSLALPQ
jgi:hypothetical protein